jgi:RNA polymerase sigma factor (sigma-70 family)
VADPQAYLRRLAREDGVDGDDLFDEATPDLIRDSRLSPEPEAAARVPVLDSPPIPEQSQSAHLSSPGVKTIMKSDERHDAVPPLGTVANPGDWLLHRIPDWPRIWGACQRRTRSWPIPPRWGSRDWREELDAESLAAACGALRTYDPSRGPSLSSYVYHQILSSALTRYRREWSYALRCASSEFGLENASHVGDPSSAIAEHERLKCTVNRLVDRDRRLIERLFWDGWTEARLAGSLGISQQAVSKRKHRILLHLRRRLGSRSEA